MRSNTRQRRFCGQLSPTATSSRFSVRLRRRQPVWRAEGAQELVRGLERVETPDVHKVSPRGATPSRLTRSVRGQGRRAIPRWKSPGIARYRGVSSVLSVAVETGVVTIPPVPAAGVDGVLP